MSKKLKETIKLCKFEYPTSKFPFYHVNIFVEFENSAFEVNKVISNGNKIRDYQVFQDNKELFDKTIHPGRKGNIVARVNWENKKSYKLKIEGELPSGEQTELKEIEVKAPSYGGYWDSDWEHYAGVVLSENAGISRCREPVHLTASFYKDRIDSSDEIRVVGIDPETGMAEETPSQIYGFDEWNVSRLVEEEPFRYQPTVTLDLVFLASVSANSEKVYLIFYGNPQAQNPLYKSDLKVSGESYQSEVENDYYRMKLHDKSGFIDQIDIKQGINSILDHHMEPPGTVHWNPGCYAPPRIWSHASDWDPPAYTTGIEGPLFMMRKYWGKLPFDVKQVSASVTYSFYAHNPYVIISTALRIDEEIAVKALRNGEFVFKKELFDEFVWKDKTGEVGRLELAQARPHPSPAVRISPDPPWLALLNREQGYGFGGITLSYVNERFGKGLVRTTQPHFYVEAGPWVYWCRPLVNTFVTNNPQRLVPVPEGCLYLERNAYLPFKLKLDEGKEYEVLDRYRKMLTNPLEVLEVNMDTDERVPEKWVQGIISEEFQELSPEEVFHPDQDK